MLELSELLDAHELEPTGEGRSRAQDAGGSPEGQPSEGRESTVS